MTRAGSTGGAVDGRAAGPVGADGERRRRWGLGAAAILILVVMGGAVAHVFVRLKKLDAAYALGRAQKERTELLERRRKLKIEIGGLNDPSRIVEIARDKLGMGPPAPSDIHVLGGGSEGSP